MMVLLSRLDELLYTNEAIASARRLVTQNCLLAPRLSSVLQPILPRRSLHRDVHAPQRSVPVSPPARFVLHAASRASTSTRRAPQPGVARSQPRPAWSRTRREQPAGWGLQTPAAQLNAQLRTGRQVPTPPACSLAVSFHH